MNKSVMKINEFCLVSISEVCKKFKVVEDRSNWKRNKFLFANQYPPKEKINTKLKKFWYLSSPGARLVGAGGTKFPCAIMYVPLFG